MRRRAFIAGLGGAAALWPMRLRAQKVPRLDVLLPLLDSDPEQFSRRDGDREGAGPCSSVRAAGRGRRGR